MSVVPMQSSAFSRRCNFAGKVWAIFKAFQIRRQRRHAARTLAGLNEYILKDMGISRCEIQDVVYGPSPDRRRRDDEV
jgi:uncharacterized protein YjiS (DUF1127 family)